MTIYRKQGAPEFHSDQHGDELAAGEKHNPDDQWECESDSSGTSTGAVVSDNGPPPGYRVKENMLDDSSQERDSEELCPDESPISAQSPRQHAPQDEADEPQTANSPQLSPLEGSYITRHPTILTPGAMSRRGCYSDEDYDLLAQIDMYDSPSAHDAAEFEDFAFGSTRGFSQPPNQQNSEFQTYRPLQQIIADGVGFDLMSPTDDAPSSLTSPTTSRAPTPSSIHGRGRSRSTSSSASRSRSPSPAYGAWISDKPRRKRPSFLDRAQAHLERSIHEHLVKAGQRPLPSFKVLGVEKLAKKIESPCDDSDESAYVPFPAMSPSHTEAHRRERMGAFPQTYGRQHERRSRTLSPKRWADEQAADKEVDTGNPHHATISASMGKYIESMTEKHSLAALHIDTRLKPLPPPPGISELETPGAHDPGPTTTTTNPALSPESPYFSRHTATQINDDDDDVKVYDSTPTSWAALESLSLDAENNNNGRGSSSTHHHPKSSYIKGRETEFRCRPPQRRQQQQQQQQQQKRQKQNQRSKTDPPQLASRLRLPLGLEHDRGPGAEARAATTTTARARTPLSGDQLSFASLPSPLEDLFRPFPFRSG